MREEDDIPDRALIRQNHDQTVDSDSFAAGRRHSVRESADIILVEHHRIFVPAFTLAHLFFDANEPAFVNAVLDRVAPHLRPSEPALCAWANSS